MQEGLSSYRRISLSLGLGFALVSLVLIAPCNLRAAANEQMITFSGQRLPSIFDGLHPSRFARYSVTTRGGSRKVSWLLEEKTLGRHAGAHLRVACSSCGSDTTCAGHYEVITACSGCCTNSTGCPALNNFHSDTQHATYQDGEYDCFCGEDCCTDAGGCDNP
jgi:ribosomal protein S27E